MGSVSANTLRLVVTFYKRALKAILLKTTALATSDHNYLSILPLKQILNYNEGVLIHKIMSGIAPPAVKANISSESVSTLENSTYQSLKLTSSGLD